MDGVSLITVGFGIYAIVYGFIANYFIDESEGTATDEQKERHKATPTRRALVIASGIVFIAFGIYHYAHQK